MSKQKATVHEVAKRTGVSIATVSRVVNGVGQVAPETRQRVQAAIVELRYRPNYVGRALAVRRYAALGIVFPGLAGPYYADVIQGFEAEAVAANQGVMIFGTHLLKQSEEQVLDMAQRVDGIAIMGGTISDKTVQTLVEENIPVVLLARRQIEGIATVCVDNYHSTLALTLHLIEIHNYERISFIGNPTGSPDVTERWDGFVEACRRAGRDPGQPVRVGLQQADGLLAATRLLDTDAPPQAMVCANDGIALGVYGAAAARGVPIPKQLAVTGWDDTAMATLISPPLTTVRQPIRELGTKTAQLLLKSIQGELDAAPEIVLPTELMIRASCGCPYTPSAHETTFLDLT